MLSEFHQPVVLVVDDAPDSLGFLCDALSQAGYTVLIAHDGASAGRRIDPLRRASVRGAGDAAGLCESRPIA